MANTVAQPCAPLADAFILVGCAYTALATSEQYGLLGRERAWYARLFPHFRRVVVLSYGSAHDHKVAATLGPPGWSCEVSCVCNDQNLDPALFLASAPDRVAAVLAASNVRSALIYTDQFWGGDAAVNIARALRARGIRTSLLARGGYHWSWTVARESGPESPQAAQAAMLEGELCRAADFVAVTTQRIADDLAWRYALPKAHFRVIPNFVLTDTPVPPFASRQRGQILTAGRLAREKRVHLLIEAVAKLPEPLRVITRLVVIGQGPLEAELKALAANLHAPVEFLSRVPHAELMERMGKCNIYAQCSEYEGHPKTILEAMAMGAPLLVTDSPGIVDHVRNGRTGVVSLADAGSLSSHIADLLNDPKQAKLIGRAGSAHIRRPAADGGLSLDCTFPLLFAACREAMASAGTGAALPAAGVRWDQPLLLADPLAAAQAWAGSVDAFVRRLTPAQRAAFIDGLLARLPGPEDALISVLPARA